MKIPRQLVFLLAFVLMPRLAHAGFIDWLENLDPGPFVGVGEDLNVLCIDKDGVSYPLCGRLILLPKDLNLKSDDIRHIIILRPEFFLKKPGERFKDVTDRGTIRIFRLDGLYRYRLSPEIDIGAARA